jgi:hypothetical protein
MLNQMDAMKTVWRFFCTLDQKLILFLQKDAFNILVWM